MRPAFTLLEIMVVIAIIAALMAMTLPVVGSIRARQAIQKTRSQIMLIGSQIKSYEGGRTAVVVPSSGATRRLWDFDGDGLLDGEPEFDPSFDGAERDMCKRVGYLGVIAHLKPAGIRSDGSRRPLDSWEEPLRISYGGEEYGGAGLGIWSSGPDRIPWNDDDIHSWKDTGREQ